jgi:serine/threonine protein phosphatase 1
MVNDSLAPGRLPPGLRVYAIGDVHGCDDRLAALHAQIAGDARHRPGPRIAIVHLGDYVDRGPDSAAVVERLLGPSPVPGADVVTLMGNHEEMMLDAIDADGAPDAVSIWLMNGGGPTLASYGANHDPATWDLVPERHLDFLRACPLRWSAGGYLFVHAGIRPGVSLAEQTPHDLLWIREPFLSFQGALGWVVVHGHTPASAVQVKLHRIGLDTGAVFGGPLSCAVLEADRIRLLYA